ncbi:phenylalanyl-tRNA synthetase, putative [Actinidia rufa]|uniref:phenylalanine--tRNA ligase n=1 Tax=Actinidia rufa TaxID=165716 RepID=A0A7J0ET64_9ERIC|nr:phenylalanyl-tRNA synthetase, putative [Actinidia rufa]
MAEEAVLGFLEKNEEISDSSQFASERGIDHQELTNVIKSLYGFRLVDAQDIKRERWVLTEEGRAYAAAGSPEVQVFLAIPPDGISLEELQKKMDPSIFKIGRSQAIKNQWVEMGKQLVMRKVQDVEDKVKDFLIRVEGGEVIDPKEVDALKRRKLIAPQTWKGYSVRKGPNYAPKRKKYATDLTRDNLQRFEEMPTNNFVESSFWNFDALFQPQQHPARDSHDTFFLQVPSTTKTLPEDYVERVKRVHESGGYGSRGYDYVWKREEANKNLLRTHTTAVSSRMLYLLAQEGFAPKRYFSIDRVFRNEAVDRTHLAEFHQIEGLVCDRGLTLGDLIGVFNDFFGRLGMSKLKFKPAYNPYTEPSMEIFGYHEGLNKWVEIGNSGMFRPEMLLPMGLPEDVRVIAWGLSLERPTMILYGIDNIRDLFGHKVDLSLIKKNPICRIGIE